MAIIFTPRSAAEIEQSIAARTVARSRLTDIGPSADLRWLVLATAEEMGLLEQRLNGIVNSYDPTNPNISLADLKERMGELPLAQAFKQQAAASGSVMSVTRLSAAAIQVLPNGTLFGRADGVTYRTTQSYTFGIGVGTVQGIYAVCVKPGASGNCETGQVNVRTSVPSWVLNVANTAPFQGGSDGETKPVAQKRLKDYWGSLARTVPNGVQWAAETFQSASGISLRFAVLRPELDKPGNAILVVDDGSGLAGLVQPGAVTSATVPLTGIRRLWHDAPATEAIGQVNVVLAAGGNAVLLEGVDYDSVYERGIVQLRKGINLAPGDVWTISGYSVYTSVLAELQQMLEGSLQAGGSAPGWIAGGCRVKVQPPTVQTIGWDLPVVPRAGYDAIATADNAVSVGIGYTQTLGPGEPFYVARMVQAVMTLDSVENAHAYVSGTSTQLADRYANDMEVLRANAGSVKALPILPA